MFITYMFQLLSPQPVSTPLAVTAGSSQTALVTWGQSINNALINLWANLIGFLPSLIAALIVFFVGWAVAVAVGRVVEKILALLRINTAFENIQGFKTAVQRAGPALNIPLVIGEIVKWFIIVVALLAATDILGLSEVSKFLQKVLDYLPNVLGAAFVLIIGFVLGTFVHKTVAASVSAAGIRSGGVIGTISKWAIIVFAFLTALEQLNVKVLLVNTFVNAFILPFSAMIALAGGLAFGLGGKDMAAKWLKKVESDFTGKNES